MSYITEENAGSGIAFSCEDNNFSPRNKRRGERELWSVGFSCRRNKFYFCTSEPYSINAEHVMLTINSSVNDISNRVHGPLHPGSFCLWDISVVIPYQPVTPWKKFSLRQCSLVEKAGVLELDRPELKTSFARVKYHNVHCSSIYNS